MIDEMYIICISTGVYYFLTRLIFSEDCSGYFSDIMYVLLCAINKKINIVLSLPVEIGITLMQSIEVVLSSPLWLHSSNHDWSFSRGHFNRSSGD